ncbi:MAG: ABC transporter permease subunit [Akkermansiaceae bacterium]|nr:ABC transporter permease subunit [Akkermansiaceae bacterium]
MSRRILVVDFLMTHIIRIGGIAVVLAVLGIFAFIFREILPLFSSAKVHPEAVISAHGSGKPLVLGVDEWGEMPFLYYGKDTLTFIREKDGTRNEVPLPALQGLEVTAVAYDAVHRRVALGLADGRIGSFVVNYESKFDSDGTRSIEPVVEPEPWFAMQAGEGPVSRVAYGEGGSGRTLIGVRSANGQDVSSVLRLGQKKSLIGGGKLSLLGETEITSEVGPKVVSVLASQNGSAVLIASADGGVSYLKTDSTGVSVRQKFSPFGNSPPDRMDFLFGGTSVVLTASSGEQAVYSLFSTGSDGERLFGKTKHFDSAGTGEPVFAASQRNKTFLVGAGRSMALRHLTSGETRWAGEASFAPTLATIDGKSEHFFIAGQAGEIQRFEVKDPHPESGWRAFFGKVWYEGGSAPVYQWQSTGGTDDFEPKLSLIPLIVGSLKGTLYALLFSVPVALLAAVFSASFLPAEMKRVVKPAMEIMASLPSVVLGFLAGIWLAPLIEQRVPSIFMVIIVLPLTAIAVGWFWSRQPMRIRQRFSGGREWLVLMPLLLAVGYGAWSCGPLIEKLFFIYKDPATSREIADFRLWWPQATGSTFDQRNSLVVGFMMGFAVIPVIFTIAEDAISNVPKTLSAAAAALGASRWQVVRTVILPVASPGIFSALMIGFGRAVGETMIVVMATGNTPVTEWNIFSGMRTLSANVAVELPEAAPGSTHYRTLFLGAFVLFVLTFTLNTVAEVLRQHLREKNKLA